MYLKKALSPCFEGSHVKSMKLYGEALGWGYGYFNCNAREHLNKLIKTLEVGNTNLSQDRFFTITRNLRVRQFYYPESIFSTNTVICSRQVTTRKIKAALTIETSLNLIILMNLRTRISEKFTLIRFRTLQD